MFNKEENSSLGGLPARCSGCSRFCTRRSSALSSSRLRSLVPLALAVVKSTVNPSRSPNLFAHDANFDGLSIAVFSHAFNSFESFHNSMTSSSLRSSTVQPLLLKLFFVSVEAKDAMSVRSCVRLDARAGQRGCLASRCGPASIGRSAKS